MTASRAGGEKQTKDVEMKRQKILVHKELSVMLSSYENTKKVVLEIIIGIMLDLNDLYEKGRLNLGLLIIILDEIINFVNDGSIITTNDLIAMPKVLMNHHKIIQAVERTTSLIGMTDTEGKDGIRDLSLDEIDTLLESSFENEIMDGEKKEILQTTCTLLSYLTVAREYGILALLDHIMYEKNPKLKIFLILVTEPKIERNAVYELLETFLDLDLCQDIEKYVIALFARYIRNGRCVHEARVEIEDLIKTRIYTYTEILNVQKAK